MAELRVPSEVSLIRSGVVLWLLPEPSFGGETIDAAEEDEDCSGFRRRDGVTGGLNS